MPTCQLTLVTVDGLMDRAGHTHNKALAQKGGSLPFTEDNMAMDGGSNGSPTVFTSRNTKPRTRSPVVHLADEPQPPNIAPSLREIAVQSLLRSIPFSWRVSFRGPSINVSASLPTKINSVCNISRRGVRASSLRQESTNGLVLHSQLTTFGSNDPHVLADIIVAASCAPNVCR